MADSMILLVEDDPGLRVSIARVLQQNGFVVHQAGTGAEMWSALRKRAVNLILLDIALPGKSGIELCREVRKDNNVPIIFVSAKGDEASRITGLDVGADDYITKPVRTRELLARIRAVLRRQHCDSVAGVRAEPRFRFDGWEVDLRRRTVFSPTGALVELTGAEFDLLASFIGSPQRVLARDRLIELSRARLAAGSDRSIDVLVSRLRRKLSQAGWPSPIVTVRGAGYMLTADVACA